MAKVELRRYDNAWERPLTARRGDRFAQTIDNERLTPFRTAVLPGMEPTRACRLDGRGLPMARRIIRGFNVRSIGRRAGRKSSADARHDRDRERGCPGRAAAEGAGYPRAGSRGATP
jgi:hypothetical protein